MLLIGGVALQFWLGSKFPRRPMDTDLICTWEEYEDFVKRNRHLILAAYPMSGKNMVVKTKENGIFEFEIAWEGSSAEQLMQNGSGFTEYPLFDGTDAWLVSSSILYWLKMSHRYLRNSPHFLKTMNDILLMRKSLPEAHQRLDWSLWLADWYKQREKETYDYKHPRLNQSKAGFFNGDGVNYVYDHDSIHEAVAQDGAPAYTKYKGDRVEVMCSKDLFFSVPEITRLHGVLEEAYVLALERSQIPFRGKVDPDRSFNMALMKVCTSITSGWFREYAWEHYYEVMSLYDPDYSRKFFEKVDGGLVKPYTSPSY